MNDLTISEALQVERAHGKPITELFAGDDILRGIVNERRLRQAERAAAEQRMAKADERIVQLDRLHSRRIKQLHDEWKARA